MHVILDEQEAWSFMSLVTSLVIDQVELSDAADAIAGFGTELSELFFQICEARRMKCGLNAPVLRYTESCIFEENVILFSLKKCILLFLRRMRALSELHKIIEKIFSK